MHEKKYFKIFSIIDKLTWKEKNSEYLRYIWKLIPLDHVVWITYTCIDEAVDYMAMHFAIGYQYSLAIITHRKRKELWLTHFFRISLTPQTSTEVMYASGPGIFACTLAAVTSVYFK